MPPSPDDPSLSGQEAVCAVAVSGGKAELPVTPHASQARAAVCSPRLIHLIMLVKWTIRTPVRRPFRRRVRLLLNGRSNTARAPLDVRGCVSLAGRSP
jgi:hypothetical protein